MLDSGADNQYEIISNENFDDGDTGELWEFLPGDIVVAGQRTFNDGTNRLSALSLVTPSARADRKYWEFMFLATIGRLPIAIETYIKYEPEINRIRAIEGQFIYPAVLAAIKQLRRLKRTASDRT